MIPLLLALAAQADPVAQRSPVDGDAVLVVGAPHQAVAWRLPGETRWVVSATTRTPSLATGVSVGSSVCGGPSCGEDPGWRWVGGASTGLVATRGPSVALSVAPWARLERRGRVHGGVQVAAPIAAGATGGIRVPVVGELFIGSRRERVHVVAVGGAGWAWTTGTPAGSLIVQGTVQVGVSLRGTRPEAASAPETR